MFERMAEYEKKQCKIVCVIIKRKSVTVLELSEIFNSYC